MASRYPHLRPARKDDDEESRASFTPLVPKPRATTIACGECRKSKTKVRAPTYCIRQLVAIMTDPTLHQCDGARPSCSRCVRNDATCVYTGGIDETPTAALKRTAKYHEERNAELEELIQLLRIRPEHEAIDILRRLRTSRDVSSVLGFIKEGELLIQSFGSPSGSEGVPTPPNNSTIQVELANSYPNVYLRTIPSWLDRGDQQISTTWIDKQVEGEDDHRLTSNEGVILSRIRRLSNSRKSNNIDFSRFPDERIYRASCHPWTSVIKDDNLFRTLISLYLTWLHPEFTVFDKDCFLDDLVSQDTTFCSPMLVTAILSISYVC